jgi:hypothetical protein
MPASRRAVLSLPKTTLSAGSPEFYRSVMSEEQTPGRDAFERSREKRRGVRQAGVDLEQALARPAARDPGAWSKDTAVCLHTLGEAFQRHAEQSEGPDGLLNQIVDTAPRLANGVHQIIDEHQHLLSDMARLEKDATDSSGDPQQVQRLREQALGILRAVAAHRQRGADLIYESYSVDIEAGD